MIYRVDASPEDKRLGRLQASPLMEQDTLAALVVALIVIAQERGVIPVNRALSATGLTTTEYAARKRDLATLGAALATRVIRADETD